jgi:cyclopropane fatty-acyl-phospholipid synthase-like methyltransferase
MDELEEVLEREGGTPDTLIDEVAIEWPKIRVQVSNLVWGEGYYLPGGVNCAVDLVSGLSLSAADSLLQIGSGLGGDQVAIIKRFGSYITSYEQVELLRRVASEQAVKFDLETKLTVHTLDPEKNKFRSGFYNGALIREQLYRLEAKADILTQVVGAIKPGGQITGADLFCVEDEEGEVFDEWRELEINPIHLCTVSEFGRMLKKNDVTIRLLEDMTSDYRKRAIDAWTLAVNELRRLKKNGDLFDDPVCDALMKEAHLWMARLRAFDSGKLRYFEYTGVKAG